MMEMAHICISSAAPLAAGGIAPYIILIIMMISTLKKMAMVLEIKLILGIKPGD